MLTSVSKEASKYWFLDRERRVPQYLYSTLLGDLNLKRGDPFALIDLSLNCFLSKRPDLSRLDGEDLA